MRLAIFTQRAPGERKVMGRTVSPPRQSVGMARDENQHSSALTQPRLHLEQDRFFNCMPRAGDPPDAVQRLPLARVSCRDTLQVELREPTTASRLLPRRRKRPASVPDLAASQSTHSASASNGRTRQ
ncbi:hypothetical protein DSL92_02520 [Billgrantia gudaonensis]|uniref:Uncharacterized protein n=1 Tax=Billgrantia gudaonensis TaxID=376427 RepID=A0A3S0QG99_9GAMM|nr:hypothetical protein DSL92_02520 [Halomonas gudaonensis]